MSAWAVICRIFGHSRCADEAIERCSPRVFGESHPLGRSGLALGSRLDRHAHDSVLILDQHGSPPLTRGGEQPPGQPPPIVVLDQAARA
jgi:hypothetical protein